MFHLILNNDHRHPYTINDLKTAIETAIVFNKAAAAEIDIINTLTGEIVFSIGDRVYLAESVKYII